MAKLKRDDFDAGYRLIEQAAMTGQRCPTTERRGMKGLPTGLTRALVDAGLIRVEVYAHNWRVVEILTGQYKGRRTAPPPNRNWHPYLVMEPTGA